VSEIPLRLTPGCRLRSLRSLRPTLGPSRRLLGDANGAPALRVRQPGAVRRNAQKPTQNGTHLFYDRVGYLLE
jgi:hypothetical protein